MTLKKQFTQLKTTKSLSKRFFPVGNGRTLKYWKSNNRHNLSSKTPAQKQSYSKSYYFL